MTIVKRMSKIYFPPSRHVICMMRTMLISSDNKVEFEVNRGAGSKVWGDGRIVELKLSQVLGRKAGASIFTCKAAPSTNTFIQVHIAATATMSTDPRRRAQPPPPPPPPEDVPDTTTMGMDGTGDHSQQPATNGQKPGEQPPPTPATDESFKLKFCTVCASNNNR